MASDYKIEILGINIFAFDAGSNALATASVDLPWLQDASPDSAFSTWAPTLRDVVIVNPANEQISVFNLLTNDLTVENNRIMLRGMLLNAAKFRDDDGDGLSDYWEEAYGDGSSGPSDDTDGDRSVELLEYAHGSHPGKPSSLPLFTTGLVEAGVEQHLSVTFRRRLGAAAGLTYVLESGETPGSWSTDPADLVEVNRVNPYDGTGTELVTYRFARPVTSEEGRGFLRVRTILP